jgi:hemerythrin-like domain-containing protein
MAHQRLRRVRHPRRRVLIPLAAAGIAGVAVRAGRHAKHSSDSDGPTDVGFMRAMHDALRRDMARLESVDERGSRAEPRFGEAWAELRARLDRHHRAEDDDLWPILRRHLTAPEDRHEVDRMVDEHRALSEAIAVVDRAFATETRQATAIAALSAALNEHLDHEERTVLPLLERHLSPAEWHRFLITERRRTPLHERPDFLGWVLDEASDADAAAVLSELPPPGRLVYRYVIRPRYAARHRRQMARTSLAS